MTTLLYSIKRRSVENIACSNITTAMFTYIVVLVENIACSNITTAIFTYIVPLSIIQLPLNIISVNTHYYADQLSNHDLSSLLNYVYY